MGFEFTQVSSPQPRHPSRVMFELCATVKNTCLLNYLAFRRPVVVIMAYTRSFADGTCVSNRVETNNLEDVHHARPIGFPSCETTS